MRNMEEVGMPKIAIGFVLLFASAAGANTVGLLQHDPGTSPGYTLFTQLRYTQIFLIDNHGKVVHSWQTDLETANTAYLLDNGHLMRCLGTLATIVESGVSNLILFVLVNGTYEITGNQKVPARGSVDWSHMARAGGFKRVFRFDNAKDYEERLFWILREKGPTFVEVQVEPGAEGPISRSEKEEAEYLKVSLAESARRLKRALQG